MTDRYFGKVVALPNEYSVVMNKGAEQGVQVGHIFMVVGLGDVIMDPDTNEELERLEIVRGRVKVTHVQPKIATLESCDYTKSEDVKEVKKVIWNGGLAMFGPQDTVTESIKPGEKHLKALEDANVGDYVIKL